MGWGHRGSRAARLMAALLGATLCGAAACATQTLVIAAEDDAAPWSYADGSGYANDLVRAAFQKAGQPVSLKVMPYARCKALTLEGAIAGCLSMSETPELKGRLGFPRQPLFRATNLLVAAEGSPLSGCDPTRWPFKPLVGVVRGYEYTPQVDALFAGGAARRDEANSEVSGLRKIAAGHVNAAIITVDEVKRMPFVASLAGLPPDFKTVCDFGGQPAYIAFSLSHPQGAQALASFERGMQELEKSGSVASLQQAWRGRLLKNHGAKEH